MQQHKIDHTGVRSLPLILKMEFDINASTEVFYKWFSDFSHYTLMFDHVIKFERTGPPSEGRYIETARNFWGALEQYEVTIIEDAPSQLITVSVSNPRVMGFFRFVFTPAGACTHFTIEHYTSHQNPLQVLILRCGLWLLFIRRKRRADERLRELFKS
jgi:hypothetical protein